MRISIPDLKAAILAVGIAISPFALKANAGDLADTAIAPGGALTPAAALDAAGLVDTCQGDGRVATVDATGGAA